MGSFSRFKAELKEQIADEVVSIVEFGSSWGEQNPQISDIDLLIVAKHRESISKLFLKIRKIEKETLGTVHSGLTDALEEELFVSDDFSGVHLVILARDELGKDWRPKSFRMKLVTTFLISEPILFYHLKNESNLIIGQDIVRELGHFDVSFKDRLAAFVPFILLWLLIPFIAKNKTKFRVWCFKILKYHGDCVLVYEKIKSGNNKIELREILSGNKLVLDAYNYRYRPNEYGFGTGVLFVQTLISLLKDLPWVISAGRQHSLVKKSSFS